MERIIDPVSTDRYAVIYCRESKEDYVKSPSLEMQEKICREYCEDEGWKVDKVFIEEPKEKYENRDSQLIEALLHCRLNSSKIVGFVVWGYAPLEWEEGICFGCKMLLANYDVRFESASSDDVPELDFVENIICTMKHYELKVAALHWFITLLKARESGKFSGSVPVGYLYNENAEGIGVLCVDPDRGNLITAAFEMFAKGIFSIKEVVDHINYLGFRSLTQSKQMTIAKLTGVLKNRIYIGEIFVNDEIGFVPSAFAPLVSRDVFDTVQKLLSNRERLNARDYREEELSSKFVMQKV